MDDKYERSRKNMATLPKFEIAFTGPFKNAFHWNHDLLINLKDGLYHIIGKTTYLNHLVPVGGNMWDKVSVPKDRMKIIRRVK